MRIQVAVFTFTFLILEIKCPLPPSDDEEAFKLGGTTASTTIKTDYSAYGYETLCKFQNNAVDCTGKGGSTKRYYFDLKLQDCRPFQFGYCPTSYNNFNTLTECWETCRDEGIKKIDVNLTLSVTCRLQPDFGTCYSYYPMWYFDINERTCKGFSYSGCGGNQNRFSSSQLCVATCPKITDF